MKIAICSSMHFFEQFMDLKDSLESFGLEVLVPERKVEMPSKFGEGQTSIRSYFEANGGIDSFPFDHEIWKEKGKAILHHFEKIESSDAILVTNFLKKGIRGYIGPNTFLEIGYAFALKKTIYVLFSWPDDSPFKEELYGMQPIVVGSTEKFLELVSS